MDGIIIGGGVVARPLQFQLGKFTNMNGIIEKQDPGWDVIDEDEMQGSYNWQRNDPLLPEVDTTTLCQIRRSEESHTNELWQRIQALKAQIIEYNKSKYDKISTNGQRGKNILQQSKHTLSTQDQINQRVVAAFLCESVCPQTKILQKN